MKIIHTITDIHAERDAIVRARYGVIEAARGQVEQITLRPWPKLFSLRELWPVGDRYHARGGGDRCWLYYNHPRSAPTFLALKYVVSTSGAQYKSICATLRMLDQIAEWKQIDGLVCDAANSRLSDRLMRRHGWKPHAAMRWRRNYIRRFYGEYPSVTPATPRRSAAAVVDSAVAPPLPFSR